MTKCDMSICCLVTAKNIISSLRHANCMWLHVAVNPIVRERKDLTVLNGSNDRVKYLISMAVMAYVVFIIMSMWFFILLSFIQMKKPACAGFLMLLYVSSSASLSVV